jgi:hypothetical protein
MVDSKYYSIIEKLSSYKSLSESFIGQSYSGINSNDERLSDDNTKTSMLCYVSQIKGFIKYIEKDKLEKDRDFNKWKIITARSAHGANSAFGNMFIGKPNELCNQSYVLFEVVNEEEATSLLSYMKCRLPNFMLSLRKASQDICESTCKWIPLPPLNKEWTDVEVYKYFKLSEDDIKLINDTNIIGYKNIVNKTEGSVETPEHKPKRVIKKKAHVQEPVLVEAVIEQPIKPKIKLKRVLKIKSNIEKVDEPIIQPTEPVVVEEVKQKKIIKKKLKLIEV